MLFLLYFFNQIHAALMNIGGFFQKHKKIGISSHKIRKSCHVSTWYMSMLSKVSEPIKWWTIQYLHDGRVTVRIRSARCTSIPLRDRSKVMEYGQILLFCYYILNISIVNYYCKSITIVYSWEFTQIFLQQL